MVCNFQKLFQTFPLRRRKSGSDEASLALRYLKSSTTSSSSRAFDGAPFSVIVYVHDFCLTFVDSYHCFVGSHNVHQL